MMNKELIKKSFSKSALFYDQYSSAQKFCAEELIRRIQPDNFTNILELGCGTGSYTKLLREKFPGAKITAVDISPCMVSAAKGKGLGSGVDFVTADAEIVDFQGKFDLISSNAAFQWFEALSVTLLKYKRFLLEKGFLTFSLFGPGTFCELNGCLEELSGGLRCESCAFLNKRQIEKVLRGIYKNTQVEVKIYRETFNSVGDLLAKIKYTGTRGSGFTNRGLWTGRVIRELERIYRQKYQDITATYEIFFCKGEK